MTTLMLVWMVECSFWSILVRPCVLCRWLSLPFTKLQVFINKSLRKTLRIFWPDQITNNELWKCTKQPRIDLQIRKCKWRWLGHTPRKPTDDITGQDLEWNLQGKRSSGRPKNTWRRTVLEEAKGVKKTWAEIKCVAKNRVWWRNLVDALCSAAE